MFQLTLSKNGHCVSAVVVDIDDDNRTKVKPILSVNSLLHWLDVPLQRDVQTFAITAVFTETTAAYIR